jgi:hypothetical protein
MVYSPKILRENTRSLEGHGFRRAAMAGVLLGFRACVRTGEINRTSAAKAGCRSILYGTAEAVPFQERILTQAL